MKLRDISFLLLAWAGAAVISYLVYDWRQENDIDDLRDRLGEVEDDLGLGQDDEGGSPTTAAGGASHPAVTDTVPLVAGQQVASGDATIIVNRSPAIGQSSSSKARTQGR